MLVQWSLNLATKPKLWIPKPVVLIQFALHVRSINSCGNNIAQTTHTLSCFSKLMSTGLCVSKRWLTTAHVCRGACRHAIRTRKVQALALGCVTITIEQCDQHIKVARQACWFSIFE